ncbi:diacylglycerol/lipid kinase family protein [Streptomyces canarius]
MDDGADLLGVAGGDGTQALVAEVAAESGLPFLVIPAGTRNHFAMDLGLDREDPSAALEALTDGVELDVDLGYAGQRVFVNNVSFGAYAALAQDPAYREDNSARQCASSRNSWPATRGRSWWCAPGRSPWTDRMPCW